MVFAFAKATNLPYPRANQDTLGLQKDVLYADADTPLSDSHFDDTVVEDFKADSDFDYTESAPEDNWWTRFNQKLNELWTRFIHWLLGGSEATGFMAILVGILPYLLLCGLIALVVWLFVRIDHRDQKYKPNDLSFVNLTDDDIIIQHKEIPALIQQAIEQEKYRLAVRFYYLLNLQNLSEKGEISWQAQKTNRDYLIELKKESLRSGFMAITSLYDHIWYGNFDINSSSFAQAERRFKEFAASI